LAIDKNFVVKHGLEVNTDLILANATTNQVGIATTVTKYTLHVNGGIGATNLSITGVATFPQLVLSGTVSAASTTGISGQYLKSTGSGVAWEDFPVGRTSTTFVAAPGQDTFSFSYSVGLVDVFVNGIKLTPSEFNASDGVSIVLNTTCFGGEVVDVHAYSVSGIGVGGTGITGLTVQDEGSIIGTPQGVTSINFIGAGLTASASGAGLTVSLQDAWTPTSAGINTLSNVGIATTNPRFALEVGSVGYGDTALWVNGNARITGILTVGTSSIVLDGVTDTLTVPNLVVTNSTSGSSIVIRDNGSISGSASVIDFGDNLSVTFSSGIATITGSAGGGSSSQWTTTAAGIHTLSNVGIGTTNSTSALTVKGNTSLETLNVSGITTISGDGTNAYLEYGSSNAYTNFVTTYNVSQVGGVSLISADANGAALSADTTLNASYARIQTLGAGVTVNGTTFTNQLSVSGVSTLTTTDFTGHITLKGTSGSSSLYVLDDNSAVFGDGNDLTISHNSSNSVTRIREDGGNLEISANPIKLQHSDSTKLETLGTGVTVTGTTFTNQLSVSGVSTFSGNVRVGVDTSSGVILTSPNGTQFRLIVDDSGTLSTTAV
jgi:hypothetical protein